MTETSLGTVKSRLVRGRDALKTRLMRVARELGQEFGAEVNRTGAEERRRAAEMARRKRESEVRP